MPAPAAEARRLRALRDLNILDTDGEDRFDRITRLAARLFGVPTALVSLVDADRLWFKSRVGFPYPETPSAQSFCRHAIEQDEMLVVCDATTDPRFSDSRYVTGYPQARFYAGQPLVVNGARIGTLCLIDEAPRAFDADERALLRDLAAMVANEASTGALREAQQRVRRSEAVLRALLEHLPNCVLLVGGNGQVLSCNAAAERLFGMPAAALVGRCGWQLLGVQEDALLPTGGAGHIDPAGIGRTIRSTVTRPDGTAITIEAALNALDIGGRVHVAASVRDIGPHLAAQQASETMRRDYFRRATHELRTPLASIVGFSELLLKSEFDAATGRELLGIIHSQSGRLVTLINQMLDLARIEAGDLDERRRGRSALPTLVTEALAATIPAARTSDLVLAQQGGVPDIAANDQRLRQAFANVLSNAVKFSSPGTPIEVTLAPCARDGRQGAEVRIRDHGAGLTLQQQGKMFQHFYRSGERPAQEGGGLGLALARAILAAHDGTIEIASTCGSGTVVTVWLPACAEAP